MNTTTITKALQAARECIHTDRQGLADASMRPDNTMEPEAAAAVAEYDAVLQQVDGAISATKDGGWVAVDDCLDGDVWFALSCGHVVMGWKQGDMLDWEAMIDHDCCHDAHAVKAQQVATPTHPDLIG